MSFAFLKSAPSLTLAADERMFLMMAEMTWIAPFDGGGGEFTGESVGLLERKKYPPALERAFVQERYEVSLWM